jgi:glycine C-acetyltransferase
VTAAIDFNAGGYRVQTKLDVPAGPVRTRQMLPVLQSLTNTIAELAVKGVEEKGDKITCKAGCGACCRQVVPITQMEAYHIRDLVNDLPEPRQSAVRARFDAAIRRVQEAGLLDTLRLPEIPRKDVDRLALEYFHLGIPCPFLEDESCSIHPDRPLVCRQYLVTSPAEHCAHPTEKAVRGVTLPANVHNAAARLGQPMDSRTAPAVRLILALEWADAHPEPPPARSGPELLQELFERLDAQKEERKVTAAAFGELLQELIANIREQGLYKAERRLQGAQGPAIRVGGTEVINFCANNYLGLANHPAVVEAAHEGLRRYGYGLASVRFICGTQDLHKQLESAIAGFLRKDDAILYTSCFDANGGLFETLFDEPDVILSDELNHASIIDGIRLCKAKRVRYRHSDMTELETRLKEAGTCRARVIATDGVFSMDGDMARLPEICELAERYKAIVMVDDSHATGILGAHGRGTPEQLGVLDRVDIITSTLGKALGGAAGGFTCARAEIVEYLRQRSRPYLFSNSLPPMIAMAALKAVELVGAGQELRNRLHANAAYLRGALEDAGFKLKPGQHPILPVMLGDAALASRMAERLLERGIYVIAFSYPVVPKDQARIRIQVSAAHTSAQLEHAARAFAEVGKELGVI